MSTRGYFKLTLVPATGTAVLRIAVSPDATDSPDCVRRTSTSGKER
jgi:hypothetical protein